MKLTRQRIIPNTLERARSTYQEYPSQFWVLVLGVFIDRLGGALLFPFLTLYLTQHFAIGMTQVGVIFGIYSISSVTGSMIGGALTDRLGRKVMLLFGLVMSALSSLLMGFINQLVFLYVVILVVGVLSEVGGPASQALVADLLPDEKRAQGFGIIRVVVNLAVTFGPLIGGLLATRSYLLLFICDAVTSVITAIFVSFALREPPHEAVSEEETQPSMAQTFRGYFDVIRDTAFLWFMAASVLMVLVYMQMNTTLAVYLRDAHGISAQGFGYILSLNAAMVVVFQFAITRRITKFRPLLVMVAGTLLYALGFAMYGFVSLYGMFLLAMAIITIGEMLVSPVGSAIVARMAPEDMRGRYMAVYGFSWVIPMAVGPLLAGLVMDNFNSAYVWYLAGILGLAAAGAYYALELRVGRSAWEAVDKRLKIMEKLENQQISAEEATRLLEGVSEGSWEKLAIPKEAVQRQHVRIRISDLASGIMKVDLRLPVGLVNTVLYMGGHLSPDLENYDPNKLKALIETLSPQQGKKHLDADGERLEVSID
ncbi:MAG: MFS transporter [Anaerolineales bacterium]|jgi:MFS family permease